jgi:hypothetical protein
VTKRSRAERTQRARAEQHKYHDLRLEGVPRRIADRGYHGQGGKTHCVTVTVPSLANGPRVLDLTGKGIKLTQLTSSNTYFDMTGNGYKNLTAWAAAGNGVLFFDPTGTGQLTQSNQINFTDWDRGAATDMQALLDVFDTNHDGTLDAGDAGFANFFVMVTNANGTQTAHRWQASASPRSTSMPMRCTSRCRTAPRSTARRRIRRVRARPARPRP